MPPPSRPDDNNPANAGRVSPRPPIGGPPPKPGAPLPAKPAAAPPKADTAAVTAALPLVPGEETVWEKYSPNGEPALSGISSLLLHGLLLGLLVFSAAIAGCWSGQKVDLDELETVEIGNGEEGGGGGNPEGEGNAPGNLSRPQDDVKQLTEDKTPKPVLPEEDLKVKASKPDEIPDPSDLVMEKLKNKQEAKKLGPVLKDALEGLAGKGLGGSGQGGGEGTGFGKGKGSGVGDGTGRMNRRGRRQMRWELFWGQLDARVYLQQTEAAGMWPVVIDRNGNPMKVVDYRQKPAKLELMDVKASKRNWFTDDKADSTTNIAAELGLDFVPVAVLFFYPIEFEEALLKKELA